MTEGISQSTAAAARVWRFGRPLKQRILRECVARSRATRSGKVFAWLVASVGQRAYKAKASLAKLHPNGYVSHLADVVHPDVRLGRHVFLGDRTVLYGTKSGGFIEIGDEAKLYGDTIFETDFEGSIVVGQGTHIQPHCRVTAAQKAVRIGKRCEIASGCALYSFDHGFALGEPIRGQALTSKGDIEIGDDVWLGYGVVVLSGVKIGHGAVVGASALVTKSVPDNAIAVGNPARVIGYRKPESPQ